MKAKELKDFLTKKISEIKNSERFKEFIDFCSNFHNYSYYNLLSIYLHKPNATWVAGIKTWNRLERRIKKGERGIPILAPIIKKVEEIDKETGEVIKIEKLAGFRIVYVWDVSQTHGKELPIDKIAKPLKGKAEQYPTLKQLVSEKFCPVIEKPLGKELKGYTDYSIIAINSELDEAHKLKTLFHELSHYLLHSSVDYSKTRKEFEAELTAYLVCRKLGIDSSSYSLDYLAIYSELKNEEFEKAVDKSIKAADHIFSTLTSKQFKTA